MTLGRIAAILTCHDLGRTLQAALDSIEGQTRAAAEILVVDDGSTDLFTRQLLARVERGGTRVVQAGGRGVCAARNLGARLTSADYLVCLDADDTLDPQYFAAAGDTLDKDSGLDFVSSALRACGAARYTWTPSPPNFVDAVATGGVPHASTMLRRRVWDDVGGFDETLPSFELLDFWATVFERGFRGVVLEEPLLNYRVRAASGYRRSIQPAAYRERLGHFYSKHRAAVERHGLDLIGAKEAFFISQREYNQMIETRAAALEAELTALRNQIDEVTRSLEAFGTTRVDWGDLRRTQPLSRQWGRDRGTPVDRRYIEGFLQTHQQDIRGCVLEVRDAAYTRRFGGAAVTRADVIDRTAANPLATIVADLRRADAIAASTYDAIVLTQTLHLIDDAPAVVRECARLLRPGGVLLATVPGLIRVDDEAGPDGDFWRFTEASVRQLLADAFPIDAFDVSLCGNVMAATAFLQGFSAEELPASDLDAVDDRFPVVIAMRAVKPIEAPALRRTGGATSATAAILAYHRVAELTPDCHRLCTPPEVFRDHMAYLARHCSPIGLEALVHAAAAGRIPERAVAVTLDDGYVDALTAASPILSGLGIPATFFVNTDRLEVEHERWWDTLEGLFLGGALPPTLALDGWGDGLRVPTATREQRLDALERINRQAWSLGAGARSDLLEAVLTWAGSRPSVRATHRVLTGAEIRALAGRPGHTIGAHTIHHLALTTQPAETRRCEIDGGKAALESVLGRAVTLFAYPYGDYDADTVAIVKAAGYRASVTVDEGALRSGANRLLLPRCEITPEHHACFPARLRAIFESAGPAREHSESS